MPNLGGIPGALGVSLRAMNGRMVRGVLRPPPPAGPFFDANIPPRQMFVVAPDQWLATGEVLTDVVGNRFLMARWSIDNLLGQVHTHTFVMFAITRDVLWERSTWTIEPVSGQREASGRTTLATIPCAMEFVRRKNDALDVEEEIYRVLCNVELEEGDFLVNKRVMRVEKNLGLTYAEVL